MQNYSRTILFLLAVVASSAMIGQKSTGVNGAQVELRDQTERASRLDEPVVTLAVGPTYSPTALHTHTSGEAVVEVKINSEGSVISAERRLWLTSLDWGFKICGFAVEVCKRLKECQDCAADF